MNEISPAYRAEVAAMAKRSDQYLYQCMTGRRDMRTAEAVRIELLTNGRVRRWQLRINDWWEQWPELIGSPGAPPVPVEEQAPQEVAGA